MTAAGCHFLLYGATGYTGRLIAEAAVAAGWRPLLAGRERRALDRLAGALGLDHRAIELDDEPRLSRAVAAVPLVVHAAGPFADTWRPMVEACLRAGGHYLDINGELDVVESIARLDRRARQRGVMLLPAVGWDAVPFDCLAAELAAALPGANQLRFLFAFEPSPWLSRGSAVTLLRDAEGPVRRRHRGTLVAAPARAAGAISLAGRSLPAVPVTTAAVASAYYSTGIGTIDAACAMPVAQRLLQAASSVPLWRAGLAAAQQLLPPGPTRSFRATARTRIVAEVANPRGQRACAALVTREAYETTAHAVLAAARRVLAGDWRAGFQTPSSAFGADFALGCEGIARALCSAKAPNARGAV